MAKNLKRRIKGSAAFLIAATVSVVLMGCGDGEEYVPEEPADPEEVASIGVTLSSPGLASGSDPTEAFGAEISLAQAIAAELDTPQARWVPISDAAQTVEALEDGDLEFILGQLSQEQLSDQLAWVGPYATVQPALLVRTASAEAASDDAVALDTITSAEELAEAPVCVVRNSVTAAADLPIGDITTQQTVAECEVGMRSGRYDAIAADDMQLAGILMDPNLSSSYDVLSWSELDGDEEVEIPEELLDSHDYWIATDPEQCDAIADALGTVIDQGALTEAFSGWEETTGFEPEIADARDITTKHCAS